MSASRSSIETARRMGMLLARQGGRTYSCARDMGEGPGHLVALALDGAGKVVDTLRGYLHNHHICIPNGRADATIVVIPGWQQRPSALVPFARLLARRLNCNLRFPRTDPRGNSWLYDQMVAENELLLRQLAASGKPIILVGYSRGGQNAADFARKLICLDVEPSDISIITIATPWHGSPLAHLTMTPAGRQMVPGHSSLAEHLGLLKELVKCGVHVRHFRFSVDAVVPPATCHVEAEVIDYTPCHYSIHAPWVGSHVAEVLQQWLQQHGARAAPAAAK